MNLPRLSCGKSWLLAVLLIQFCAMPIRAQVRPQVVQAIDNTQRLELTGNVHPLARQEFDRGAAADAQPIKRILLLLKRSSEQQATLEAALETQQDKGSPNYHQWLTPEAFGAQFGPADSDIQAVTQWLTRQGFSVDKIYSGKTVIEFSGTAAQVRAAFSADIHAYQVAGKSYLANANNPQIPAALAPVISGLVSLNNFPRQFYAKYRGSVSKTPGKSKLEPLFTFPNAGNNFFGVAPGDFAIIYNSKALLAAGNDGSGQTIAIVGETNLNPQDVTDFRTVFALPANFTPGNVILNGEDPGITSLDEETEADLDVQWSGASAPGATVNLVVSASTAASAGIDLSALYIVEKNFAAVMSESYGACEATLGTTGTAFYNSLWQQAAAQGITVVISSGDNGSAGCDDFNAPSPNVATHGLAVSGFASTPYNVSVGGTDFDQNNNWSSYWNPSNYPGTSASAIGYIPEIPWNESCAQISLTGCQNGQNGSVNIVAGSGGASKLYSKPAWQMGVAGVPNDSHRDLPDVSLFASSGFTGSAYLVCQQDRDGSCNVSGSISAFNLQLVGGTSASAPAFAGVIAMVNQYQASHGASNRQGNANFVLYALAKLPNASCASAVAEAATCIFNDITKGNSQLPSNLGAGVATNSVPCKGGTPACSQTVASQTGVLIDSAHPTTEAWTAGAGYDLATGLGSVNINNLVAKWASASTVATATTLTLSPVTGVTHGSNENFTVNVTVTPTKGTASGDVSLIAKFSDGTTQGLDSFTLAGGSITNAKTQSLPGGTNYQVYAHYAGDGTNAPSDSSPVTITVAKESSQSFIVVPLYDIQTGHLLSGNATSVPYGSPYRIRIYITNSSATASLTGPPNPTCDQINELTCPTGTVTLTANGTGIDRTAGLYNLDNIGYTRDINPTLSAGTYPLLAQYHGDNSYSTSTATDSLTVTLAPTTSSINTGNINATVASPITIYMSVHSVSLGAAPSPSFTILDAGVALPASTTVANSQSGMQNGDAYVEVAATITFSTAGTHVLTVKYNGDTNYAGSTAPGSLSVSVANLSTTSLSANSLNIIVGNQVTLTATVNTAVKSPTPSNNVQFFGSSDGLFPGNVVYKSITDGSGNAALQATLLVTPLYTEQIVANFNGDTNFAGSGSTPLSLTVVTPDFSVTPTQASLTVTAGQSASAPLLVTPASNLGSQVQFTLANSASNYIVGMSCAVTPNPVILSAQKPVTATLACSVPAPSPTTSTTAAFPLRWPALNPQNPLSLASAFAILFGILLSIRPRFRTRFRRISFASFAVGFIAFVVGCGGGGGTTGGGGGGGGGGGVTQTPTSVTLTVPSTKIAPNASVMATVAVSGSQAPTGGVAIFDNTTNSQLNSATLLNGQAQIPFSLSALGSHNLVAQYYGDTKNKPSTTANPLVVIQTGTTTGAWFIAATGADAKQINLTLTVQ